MDCLLLLLFLIIIYIFIIKEGFKPNETKYLVCGDNKNNNNNNYKIIKNNINDPLKGFYSSLLNYAHKRDYNKYFNSPICEYKYDFQNNYMNANRKIDINSLKTNKEKKDLLFEESLLLRNELNDPYEKYSKVNDNFSVEYQSDDIKNQFIEGHKKMHKEI